MSQVDYSLRAEADYLAIGAHSQTEWSDAQTDLYIAQLDQACEDLSRHPGLGRSWKGPAAGVRRFNVASHVVFYVIESDGIRVLRILHRNMHAEMHVI